MPVGQTGEPTPLTRIQIGRCLYSLKLTHKNLKPTELPEIFKKYDVRLLKEEDEY